MKGKVFSPGKLLLTSEYVVLDGALALAVPTKLGQEFFFEEVADQQSLVVWEALHQGRSWLKVIIDYQSWTIKETNIPKSADFIVKVLQNIQKLSLFKFKDDFSYFLRTNLEFPSDYGWGSSSTLMNNLAEWAVIDPFILNEISLGGSGYDIAVAKEKSAILFEIIDNQKIAEPILFKPPFAEDLLLVHLNKKQDSREGISMYRSKEKSTDLVNEFSDITKQVLHASSLEGFSELMVIHENKLSSFLQIPTVKEKFFNSLPVFVKSLGAWGGDFVLTSKFPGYKEWFSANGYHTVLNYLDVTN